MTKEGLADILTSVILDMWYFDSSFINCMAQHADDMTEEEWPEVMKHQKLAEEVSVDNAVREKVLLGLDRVAQEE
jgi:hypothetical protein